MAVSSLVSPQPKNFGALVNIISGIQGLSAGGKTTINMPVNCRIHRLSFQCSGIGYSTANTTVRPSSSGNGNAVLTPVVNSQGQITGVNIVNGGSGYTAGTLIFSDPYGDYGAAGTYTVNAGAIDSVTITNGGSVAPIDPAYFFTSQEHLVNGIVMRDISAEETNNIARANGLPPEQGELAVYFTEPWRKIVDHDQATAWDLAGQNTYQIRFGIRSGIGSPDLQGLYEFDFLRNARMGTDGNPVFFLRPIKQHVFSYNVPAGQFNVTNLPVDFPLQRLWLWEADPSTGARLANGAITHIELYQDGNKVIEGTFRQVNQLIRQYGFNPDVYNYSCIFDQDQRLGKALVVDNLILRVYSAAPAVLNITAEIQNDNYS